MASKQNSFDDEIVFLNATASKKTKFDKLHNFVTSNKNVDLDLSVKKEKVF
jgi:hypothetical protein